MSFARWMDEFDPRIPEFRLDLGATRRDGTPREEISDERLFEVVPQDDLENIEQAALAAHEGRARDAAQHREDAGYGTPSYWPHDNDPED